MPMDRQAPATLAVEPSPQLLAQPFVDWNGSSRLPHCEQLEQAMQQDRQALESALPV